jgi:hypothetical protein
MAPQPDQIILPARDGYDRWAANYDTDGNPPLAERGRSMANTVHVHEA